MKNSLDKIIEKFNERFVENDLIANYIDGQEVVATDIENFIRRACQNYASSIVPVNEELPDESLDYRKAWLDCCEHMLNEIFDCRSEMLSKINE